MLVSGTGAILIARHVGSSVELFLTDGLGIAVNDQIPLDQLHVQLLGSQLWRTLCALPVSDLRLQLDEELDRFQWEMVSCSENEESVPLATRFNVSRSLVGRNSDSTKRLQPKTRNAKLKILRLESYREGAEHHRIESESEFDFETLTLGDFLELQEQHSWDILDFSSTLSLDEDTEKALYILNHRFGLICIEDNGSEISFRKQIAFKISDAVLMYPSHQHLMLILNGLAESARCVELVRASYVKGMVLYGDFKFEKLINTEVKNSDAGFRQVTSMSFDLMSSTALINEIGSERYSALLSEFHDVCSQIIVAHGGRPDAPQGDDGIMAYFGFPIATEGATRKTINAGLEMIRMVASMGLQVRVGIAVGTVAIRGGQPVGLSVHLAARIQNIAKGNSLLISQETCALVDKFFDIKLTAEQVTFKGIEAQQSVYQVLEKKSASNLGLSDSSGVSDSIIGRAAPLRLLDEALRLAALDKGSTTLVVGEPGIGKSRLLLEWRKTLRPHQCQFFAIHGDRDLRSSPFRALISAIQTFLGFESNVERHLVLDRVSEKVPELAQKMDFPSGQLFLNLLCPNDAAGQKNFGSLLPDSAEKIREKTLDLLEQLIRSLASEIPFCILLDDAQWLDPSTLELINRLELTATHSKLLIVVTMRQDGNVHWRPSLPHQTIELARLTAQESRSLLLSNPIVATLPLELIDKAIEKSEGVPLFIEETTKMLLAARAQSEALFYSDLKASTIPSSLQELLLTRLDQCGTAKLLAQIASVFGRDFYLSQLELVLQQLNDIAGLQKISTNLAMLVRHGLIFESGGDPSNAKYRFKHILLRDTAYHGMWDKDRKNLHRIVANVLRNDSEELIRLQPELLAHHLTEAGDHTQALELWEKAAKLSTVRSAHRESAGFLEAALVVVANMPESAGRSAKELKIRMSLAAKFIATEGYGAPKVQACYQQALELAMKIEDQAAIKRINLGLEGFYFMRAEFDQALTLAKNAHQDDGLNSSPWETIQARWAEANVNWHKGNLPQAVLQMNQCLELYSRDLHRPNSVQDPGVMCLCYSAWSYWEQGDAREAYRRVGQAVVLAQGLGHSFSQGIAHGFLATLHLFSGDFASSLLEANVSYNLCEESGFRVWLAHSRMIKGRALAALGNVELGIAEMQSAYKLWADTGAIVTRPLYLAFQAEVLLEDQQFDSALSLLEEGLAIAYSTGEHYHKAELLRLKAKALMKISASKQTSALAFNLLEEAIVLAKSQGKNLFVLRSLLTIYDLRLNEERKVWAQTELESIVSVVEAIAFRNTDNRFTIPELALARNLMGVEKISGLV
jgi:class 3 adenylate cyclase/tetratricopeptide (TPR) repeat protein